MPEIVHFHNYISVFDEIKIIINTEAMDFPLGKRSFIRKVKTRAQTKNIVAIFGFNQKIIFRQN